MYTNYILCYLVLTLCLWFLEETTMESRFKRHSIFPNAYLALLVLLCACTPTARPAAEQAPTEVTETATPPPPTGPSSSPVPSAGQAPIGVTGWLKSCQTMNLPNRQLATRLLEHLGKDLVFMSSEVSNPDPSSSESEAPRFIRHEIIEVLRPNLDYAITLKLSEDMFEDLMGLVEEGKFGDLETMFETMILTTWCIVEARRLGHEKIVARP